VSNEYGDSNRVCIRMLEALGLDFHGVQKVVFVFDCDEIPKIYVKGILTAADADKIAGAVCCQVQVQYVEDVSVTDDCQVVVAQRG
jgi:hypothetical protein